MKNWKHNETLINHFLCCLFFLPSPPSCISLSQTHNFVQYHFDQFHTANSRVRLAPTTCERIWKKVCRHLLLMLLLFFMDDVWYFVSIFNGINEIFNLVWLFQNYLRDTAWIRSPISDPSDLILYNRKTCFFPFFRNARPKMKMSNSTNHERDSD